MCAAHANGRIAEGVPSAMPSSSAAACGPCTATIAVSDVASWSRWRGNSPDHCSSHASTVGRVPALVTSSRWSSAPLPSSGRATTPSSMMPPSSFSRNV